MAVVVVVDLTRRPIALVVMGYHYCHCCYLNDYDCDDDDDCEVLSIVLRPTMN